MKAHIYIEQKGWTWRSFVFSRRFKYRYLRSTETSGDTLLNAATNLARQYPVTRDRVVYRRDNTQGDPFGWMYLRKEQLEDL